MTEKFLIKSFSVISRDRKVGMDISCIPWTAIYEYAKYLGLHEQPLFIDYKEPPVTLNDFIETICFLDEKKIKRYKEFQNKKDKKS